MNYKYPYINYDLVSEDSNLIQRAESLNEELSSSQQRVRKSYVDDFIVLLSSILIATTQDARAIYIPTDTNLYRGSKTRNSAYTSGLLKVINWCIQEGYLNVIERRSRAFNDAGDVVWLPAVYISSEGLIGGLEPAASSYKRNTKFGMVQLKDRVIENGIKTKFEIKQTEENTKGYEGLIRNSEALIIRHSEVMDKCKISLKGEVFNSRLTSLTRIFSHGSFDKGGRFYCQIQNVSSSSRKYLEFDDEPTIEVDYRAIHPYLLYSEVKETFSGDAYTIEDYKRSYVKKAFNILINADANSEEAIAKHLGKTRPEAQELMQAILSKHDRIKHLFNKGYGLRLQRTDSDIMYEVLKSFVDQHKPIIPIHDSAVVRLRDIEHLKLAMEAAYYSRGDRDFYPTMALSVDSLGFGGAIDKLIVDVLNGTDAIVTNEDWLRVISEWKLDTE